MEIPFIRNMIPLSIAVLTLNFILPATSEMSKIFIGQQGEMVTSEILRMPSIKNAITMDIHKEGIFNTSKDDVPLYPLADITGTSIGLINNKPTLCGGYYRYDLRSKMGYIASNECWSYTIGNNSWIEAPTMGEARQYGASVTINGTYYILGGKNSDYVPMSSIIKLDGSEWKEVGSMPWGVSSHCVAPINKTHVLVTGGDYIQNSHPMDPPQDCTNRTYILNMNDFTWKIVDPFVKNMGPNWDFQCGHSCSRTSDSGSTIIIVGAVINKITNDVFGISQTFDSVKETWTTRLQPIETLTGASIVQNGDSVLLLGGKSLTSDTALNSIYRLDKYISWELLDDKLQYARYSFSAIPFN